jgi:hypothetical protein
VSLTLAVFALAGCTTALPPRSGPERGGIGIAVIVRPPVIIPIFTRISDRVYFARMDGAQGLFSQDKVLPSNDSTRAWIYLLDVPPGRYAAVASVYSRDDREYVTVFSKEVIEATLVTVSPGAMAFMGEHLVDASARVRDAEAIQRYYLELIVPSTRTRILGVPRYAPTIFVGSLLEASRDPGTEARFLRDTADHFQGTAWAGLLGRSTQGPHGK